jgi:putative transposase
MRCWWACGEEANPAALMHHSDKGSQYTSDKFQHFWKSQNMTRSTSRRGEFWYHAAMKSLFSTVTTERCARTVYQTSEQARADVFDYIERSTTRSENTRN